MKLPYNRNTIVLIILLGIRSYVSLFHLAQLNMRDIFSTLFFPQVISNILPPIISLILVIFQYNIGYDLALVSSILDLPIAIILFGVVQKDLQAEWVFRGFHSIIVTFSYLIMVFFLSYMERKRVKFEATGWRGNGT